MADLVSLWAGKLFVLLILAFAIALVLFPLVFLTSFLYEYLAKKWEKSVPKILVMFLCTLIASFAALLAFEIYSGFVLEQVLGALGG
jgi:hypothetical protein